MTISNAYETAILGLIFNATAIADIAENDTSGPAASVYVALHTADPGEAGTQATSECAYTTYARVAVARTAGGFTVSGPTVTNAAAVNFPACTALSSTAAWFSVGKDAAGAGVILFSGQLTASLAISAGITPSFAIGALSITLD